MATREYIEKLRKQKGMSKAQAAAELGVEPQRYQVIENGKRGGLYADEIVGLAKIFGVDPLTVLYAEVEWQKI